MEEIFLPVLMIENKPYVQLGSGGEGVVYKYDQNIAFKTFPFIEKKEILDQKFQKIFALSKLQDEAFCFPLGLMKTEDFQNIGYYMEQVISDEKCQNFNDLMFLKDQKKFIECMIKASDAMERIHKKGIQLGDIRGTNIMIDQNGNPKFIDTDNYAYGDYGIDILDESSTWLFHIYHKNFSLEDQDRYLFALMMMQYFIDGVSLTVNQSDEFFKEFISLMDVSKEIKEELRFIFSDADSKPYIGSIFEEIDPSRKIMANESIYHLSHF